MTHITFLYDAPDRLAAAAAWLRQAWSRRSKVLVHLSEREAALRLDRMLWTQPQLSFVPHCFIDDPLAAETPIVLSDRLDNVPIEDYLLHLADTLPAAFSRFSHLVEIVSLEERVRLPARERFRFYRERGYPIELVNFSEAFA
ncbi:MAG: DNA polymerase III subunit chi [Rhodocyclaceae bacterium]|nr:DNA polymerase III subunit chi [Rhodocyclaceae bacterium]